ncbi:MAG: hypothetical protein NC311_18950 [Muribaculaceae bacterium]|nr:hypothetical protein [Muribaculaceae bacterium]
MKNKKNLRVCANYGKPCPLANKCDNCRNRLMKFVFVDGVKQTIIKCKKGNDTEGEKSKCFDCASEGYRCKTE